MSENLGRSDFLDAATVLRKNQIVLEIRRKEIEGELSIYKGAEEALVVLGEADRIRGEVEAKITKARADLVDLSAKVLAAEQKSREVLAGFDAEVKDARKATDDLLGKEARKKLDCAARIKILDDKAADAKKSADEKTAALDAQITEKETALNALRATIASLAKM